VSHNVTMNLHLAVTQRLEGERDDARAEVADLKRRVRLARKTALGLRQYWPLAGAEMASLLDLRKPLSRRKR
jgi:hypothetical protein